MVKKQTTLLVILDGWGVADPKNKGNAITPKTAPNYYRWLKKYPHTQLEASGVAVGLFKGQEGNSEAGHFNIGAGRVVKQDALYVSAAIKDGTFFKNGAFHQALHHVRKYKTSVHLMGLLSNHNSAHSTPEHLYALLDLLHQEGIKKVYLHIFTDGRDSGQHDALKHLKKLRSHLYGTEEIATVMGRLYGMDRNKNWERTKKAYAALVLGQGRKVASVEEALVQAYNHEESDEFVAPSVIIQGDRPVATIRDNDAVFFFNLRSDRARQIAKTFVQPNFEKMNPGSFTRQRRPKNIRFVALTDFGPDLPNMLTAFPGRDVPDSLVQTLCPRRQLYVAESEKFAHITYFLNGGYAQHFCDEQWVKIASDRVQDFEIDPRMKARHIGNYVVRAIESGQFEFIAINFANADMVGHTGNFIAGCLAISAVDEALAKIVAATQKAGATCVITADHGNAEEMLNLKTSAIDSEHSINLVPCLIITSPARAKAFGLSLSRRTLRRGKLADVAPTILKIMGIKKPSIMTGKSLF